MKKYLSPAFFLLIITALVYLPNIREFSYYKDEWYFMYDGYIGGRGIFQYMFNIDRPGRGLFFEVYYALFGPYALPYHLNGYVWRILSAVSAFWLFDMLWQNNRKFAFVAAAFFALFPGYFWWISAIEYQPHIAGLFFQVFSFALTIKALTSTTRASKIGYTLAAILTGWIYIALVDYAIGMEAFRVLCVYILVTRGEAKSAWEKIRNTLYALNWNLLIPVAFPLWRIFFFNNQREATDIGLQLGAFIAAPAETAARWFTQIFNSLLNLGVLAWVNQFPRFFFAMRLRDIGYGLGIAALVVACILIAERTLRSTSESNGSVAHAAEAFYIGLLGMAFGILPIIMANRYIDLGEFSHYSLPASLASALCLAGFAGLLSSRSVQTGMILAVIAFSAMAHYGISINVVNEEKAIQKFWWQFSWRVPALQPDVTLVINYPSGNIGDDGNGVLEAPNMIYFPQPQNQIPVHYPVSAITLNGENLQDVMLGKLYQETQYRSHTINMNYQNVLVVSQPTPTSCVHVINAAQPLISAYDPPTVSLAAPLSNIENVIVDAQPFVPQTFAFGVEPEHNWCYYFEKADLAAQIQNWDEAAALGEEALELGLHAEDQSEWMPFLKAYAITGNALRVKQTASKIGTETVLRLQACDMLTKIEEPLSNEVREIIATHYCKNAPK